MYQNYAPGEKSNANVGAGPYFRRKQRVSVDFLPDFKDGPDNFLKHHNLARDSDRLPISNLRNIYISHTLEVFDISVST